MSQPILSLARDCELGENARRRETIIPERVMTASGPILKNINARVARGERDCRINKYNHNNMRNNAVTVCHQLVGRFWTLAIKATGILHLLPYTERCRPPTEQTQCYLRNKHFWVLVIICKTHKTLASHRMNLCLQAPQKKKRYEINKKL